MPTVTPQKFKSLTHARMVRDRLCGYALEDTTPKRIERWCRAEGNWQNDIDVLRNSIGANFDGNGTPGYWNYLRELKEAIKYIAATEQRALAFLAGVKAAEKLKISETKP